MSETSPRNTSGVTNQGFVADKELGKTNDLER